MLMEAALTPTRRSRTPKRRWREALKLYFSNGGHVDLVSFGRVLLAVLVAIGALAGLDDVLILISGPLPLLDEPLLALLAAAIPIIKGVIRYRKIT